MKFSEAEAAIKAAEQIKEVADLSIERFLGDNKPFAFLLKTYPEGAVKISAEDLFRKYLEWSAETNHHPLSDTGFIEVHCTFLLK